MSRDGIFGEFGANYEYVGQPRQRTRTQVRRRRGFGALPSFPGDEGCPPMTSRFGQGGDCISIFGGQANACPPGSQAWTDPATGVFVCIPGGAPTPAPQGGGCPPGTTFMQDPITGLSACIPTGFQVPPAPPQQLPTDVTSGCPAGQIGLPPWVPCTPFPGQPQAAPPAAPPQCPPGQIGWPAMNIPCQPVPGLPQPAPAQIPTQCPPGQVGWPELSIPCQVLPFPAPIPGPKPTPTPTPTNGPKIPKRKVAPEKCPPGTAPAIDSSSGDAFCKPIKPKPKLNDGTTTALVLLAAAGVLIVGALAMKGGGKGRRTAEAA